MKKIRKVSVGGVVRHVSVDSNNDGMLDYILIKPKNTETVVRRNISGKYPFIEWEPIEVSE